MEDKINSNKTRYKSFDDNIKNDIFKLSRIYKRNNVKSGELFTILDHYYFFYYLNKMLIYFFSRKFFYFFFKLFIYFFYLIPNVQTKSLNKTNHPILTTTPTLKNNTDLMLLPSLNLNFTSPTLSLDTFDEHTRRPKGNKINKYKFKLSNEGQPRIGFNLLNDTFEIGVNNYNRKSTQIINPKPSLLTNSIYSITPPYFSTTVSNSMMPSKLKFKKRFDKHFFLSFIYIRSYDKPLSSNYNM